MHRTVLVQIAFVASVVPNRIVVPLLVVSKLVPVMTTVVPPNVGPVDGAMPVIAGTPR